MKKSKEPRPIITTPMIWIVREKSYDRYFYVATDEDLFKAALKVLTERFRAKFWYPKPSEEERPSPPEIEEQLTTLPKALRAHAETLVRDYDTAMLDYQRRVDTYKAIKYAVTHKDGRAALRALGVRSYYEYDGCKLQPVEKI